LSYFFSNEKPWPSLLQHKGGFGVVVGVYFLQERFFNVVSDSTVPRFLPYPTQSIQRKAADGAKAPQG